MLSQQELEVQWLCWGVLRCLQSFEEEKAAALAGPVVQ